MHRRLLTFTENRSGNILTKHMSIKLPDLLFDYNMNFRRRTETIPPQTS